MWEDRFQTPDYVFGTEPAAFLKTHAHHLTAGQTALCVADGEGRNSVYMAQLGLKVTALEFAPSAIAKARALAKARDVTVDFRDVDVLAYDYPEQYDVVAGIFIQFVNPTLRRALFKKMASALAPGGLMLLHGYTPKQLEYKTGGPPFVDNMYTDVVLRGLFPGWEVLESHEYEADISEGRGHSGQSALIDFIARRPG